MTDPNTSSTPSPMDAGALMDTPPRYMDHVALENLRPNPRNPKAHDLPTIDASIGRFGYLEPIVLDERTGFLISGHGRRATLAAMQDRGEAPPQGVHVTDDGTWLVPVIRGWSSRSDTEASAALIAMNRTTELGGWVDEDLLGLLDDLAATEDPAALEGVGFTDADRDALAALLDRTTDEPEPMSDEEFADFTAPATHGTLTIEGLTVTDIERFETLPGADHAERLRGLLDG